MKSELVCGFAALSFALTGCSLGQGEGVVHSDALFAHDCVQPSEGATCPFALPDGGTGMDTGCDNYDLLPDFFAAIPYRSTIQMRLQRGTDIAELSDGLAVQVNDVDKIRKALCQKNGQPDDCSIGDDGDAGVFVEVPVALPLGVRPAGAPISPLPPCDEATQVCGVAPVSVSLYLQKSCHNQNTVLYAVSGWVRFHSLFSGDANEKSAAAKYTDAEFDVTIGDPRDAPLGEPADAIPTEFTSHLTGYFRFYFERGRPGQPFSG